ncbi:MAG: bifunctional DNA-formamidopyrimidine glycosylase/DNA-(apurinic or apyrimidinic site) lyase [bacterium]
MPELPEVQTTVHGLQKTIVGLTIVDVWTDLAKQTVSRKDFLQTIKYLPFFKIFKKDVCDSKIISVERRAKNILINLANENTILIHMKMTGHLLYGSYTYDKNKHSWSVSKKEKNDALRDPYNRFIHVVFNFDNDNQLAFCDSRKFGKVTLIKNSDVNTSVHTKHLGPEILETDFDFKKFETQLLKKPNGKIKTVLMDQTILSGIGNIYSDEALWESGIHPNSTIKKVPQKDLKNLFVAVKKVLIKGIDFGGDSMSDYRRIDGTPGKFHHTHNAYRLINSTCKKSKCNGVIIKTVIGGRSAHFCNVHQKLFI